MVPGRVKHYAGDGAIYADKMDALINGWRNVWKRDLPFYYVQIAPLLYHVTRTNYVVSPEAAPRLWEAQTATLRLPKTGMIVISDCVDDLNDIHPINKKPVGERLASWALAKDYGHNEIEVSGPMFRSVEFEGDKAILQFDHVGGGLVAKGDRPLDWFVIGDESGNLYPGNAVITGETVIVTNSNVLKPTVIHFAWDEAARANFFNKAGLPAIPFRTDNPFTKKELLK